MSTSGGCASALSAVSSSSQAAPAFLSNPFGAAASVPAARSSNSVFSASTSADLFARASTAVPLSTFSFSVPFLGLSLGSGSTMSSDASGASPTLFASACSLASSSGLLFGASQGPAPHAAPFQSTIFPLYPFASMVPVVPATSNSVFSASTSAHLFARGNPFASITPFAPVTLDSLEHNLSAVDVNNLVSCSGLARGILKLLKPRTFDSTKKGKNRSSSTRASTTVVDSVVAAGTVPFLSKILSSTASTPELLLNASSCLEVISLSSNAHCDCMIRDRCYREILSVIKKFHEDQDHTSLIVVLLKTLSPVVSRGAAVQCETSEFEIGSVLSQLNQLLTHVDPQVRSQCLNLFTLPSTTVVDSVVAAGTVPFLSKILSSTASTPELLLNASSCLEVILLSSHVHCDCMIRDGCYREILSVIKKFHEDQAHTILMLVFMNTLSPIVSRIAAVQCETSEFEIGSVLSQLNQLLTHVDPQVRSQCLKLFEPISEVSDPSWTSKMSISVDLFRFLDICDSSVFDREKCLRILRNCLRSADSTIFQRLVSNHDCIPRLIKLLNGCKPIQTIFGANFAVLSLPTIFGANFVAPSLPDDLTKRSSADALQKIILEVLCLIMDGLVIAPDNRDLNLALVQLIQDESSDVLLEHVPKGFAHALLDSAELFATQLMSQHIAPFIASGASQLTAETLVSTARRHLVSKKLPVIKAYMEARIVVELSKLLSSATPSIVEDSLACLQLLVSLSSSIRDAAIAQGLLAPLFGLIAACSADPICRDIFKHSGNVLTTMIKLRPAIDVTALQPFFPEISRLVGHADAEVQFEASRVLVAITDAGHISSVFQHFDTGTVCLLLKSPDERTRSMGTRILQNYVRSADAEIIGRLISCDDCASQAVKLLKERTTVDCSNLLDPTRVLDILNAVISLGECAHWPLFSWYSCSCSNSERSLTVAYVQCA